MTDEEEEMMLLLWSGELEGEKLKAAGDFLESSAEAKELFDRLDRQGRHMNELSPDLIAVPRFAVRLVPLKKRPTVLFKRIVAVCSIAACIVLSVLLIPEKTEPGNGPLVNFPTAISPVLRPSRSNALSLSISILEREAAALASSTTSFRNKES